MRVDARNSRHGSIDKKIRDMEAIELAKEGRTADQISAFFADRDALQAKIAARGVGYCGWLSTHAQFRRDRDAFRDKWGEKISALGRFPTYPVIDLAGKEPVIAKADREYYVDYLCFYRRWCIHTLATWDLPVPMRDDIMTSSMYSPSSLDDAGITMFVPWHLLRNKDITLRDIANLRGVPNTLRPWVDGKPKNWGPLRSTLLLEIFFYLELALRQRYSDQLSNNWSRIEDALSRYFQARRRVTFSETDSFSESIKKARQELYRRLKPSVS